ncbi:transcriptional regulatory protein DevR [Nitrospira sp. KM1]|uniref:response regulator n=1 Tax=Nitrospira sp. KM1 TaxID=1936990 RepID=UPI0013A7AAB8|nr:response regulator transcription factor [Nitrospira sp. KM1]BCA54826.1 transcriptional regulatory protein DevR [Nitrospira sp. KM1]
MLTAKTKSIQVLIADAQEIFRVGLRAILGEDRTLTVAGEAATVAQTLQEVGRLKPDVVVMDLRFPDGSGSETCRTIRQQCPDTRVLFLTSEAHEEAILSAIAVDANGYVLKGINTQGLIQAIHSVAGGQSILDTAITQPVLARMKSLSEYRPANPRPPLSSQQQRVLALVAEGKTNKEIAATMALSDKTVRNYVRYIFQKLQVSRRAQAAAHCVRYSLQENFKPPRTISL